MNGVIDIPGKSFTLLSDKNQWKDTRTIPYQIVNKMYAYNVRI